MGILRRLALGVAAALVVGVVCGGEARRSTDAGDYVCNFSMYVMLDHIRRNRLDMHYGFIHIPHDYDVLKATRLVEKIVGLYGKNTFVF